MTRIIVIKRKKIYAALIAAAVVILVLLLIFNHDKKSPVSSNMLEIQTDTNTYVPGVYKGSLSLGKYNTDLYVYVDNDRVKKLSLDTDNAFINTLYPLASKSVDSINDELSSRDFSEILLDTNVSQTQSLIMQTVKDVIENVNQ